MAKAAQAGEEKKKGTRRGKKSQVTESQEVLEATVAPKADDVPSQAEVAPKADDVPSQVEVAPKADEKEAVSLVSDGIARYDVMITSERAGYRPPKAAVMAMVQQLAFRGLASPVEEAIAETWAEIYLSPGVSSHEIFIEKAYTSEAPVYHEAVMKFAEKPFFCEYSETPHRPLYWCIEFRGSRFAQPLGSFRKLFMDALNLRVSVSVRDAAPIPPHRVVPEDELPVEKKKHERGAGRAGCEVQEV